jgi:two-component system sensor histidine kinase VicK
MNNTIPFPSGFPLHEFPDLTDEVLFAFHLQINKVLYLNAAFEKVWNVSREFIGSNLSLLFDTVHPDDRVLVEDSFTNIKSDRQNQQLEFRILLPPEQQQKWIRLKAYASEKSNKEIIVGIAEDITADKDYSDTLHKFSDKKNSVLQILSHDLLGPLGNIEMSTLMLSEETKISSDESVMELVDTIKRNSKKGVTMIRDLINDEFLNSSEASLVKQRVDIVERINIVIDQLQKSRISKPPQLFEFISCSETLFVTIDDSKFMQVITNLLSNALKFTPDTGNIRITLEDKEENILIKVQDNGIGIPGHLQPFLFDKFTKARRQGIHGEPSTGLGMSIIKTIVEWHKGHISFESKEGTGTTFYIEIPKDN